jgi:tetratricopeptide (TPR) repeat protein
VPYAHGDYLEALEIYRAGERHLATTLPEDDSDRLTVETWIAETLDAMSRHAEAIAALEQLHARYAEIYGESHPLTLERLDALGRSRLRAGDHEGALLAFETTLAKLRADPSWRDALYEAVLLGNAGGALTAAERWEEAEARLLEALDRLPSAGEGEAIHRIALEANLATVRMALGDHAGARDVLVTCVERIDAEGSGSSHNGVIIRLELAHTLLELGELPEALARADEALEHARHSGSRVLVARSQLRRAQVLDRLARRREAEEALAAARRALASERGVEAWLEQLDEYEASRG